MGGVPNDLFDMPTYYGKDNLSPPAEYHRILMIYICSYLHDIDIDKWVYAYSYESKKPRKGYSEFFYDQCARLCTETLHLNLQTDLSPHNCFYVYAFLINSV